MSRLQKTVLWALAVCVFGFAAVRMMIVPVPVVAVAQEPKPGDGAGSDAPTPAEVHRFLEDRKPLPPSPAWDKGGPRVPASADDSGSMLPMPAPRQATQYGYLGLAQRQQQADLDRIRAARQKLTDAKTDDDKQAARAALRQLLADIFAQDMQMREKQAAEIESRLAKLRQQYQARDKVKDEIIDLQLKVIEQDAAGLGFPGGQSSVPTAEGGSGVGGIGGSFANRANLPRSATATPRDPMADRGGGGSARTAAEFDPIPTERTLDEVKRTHSRDVTVMRMRGHFIESADGKLYAYANVNWPDGPSVIRVVDSATGKLLGTAMVNSVIRELQFTDDGVASRERDDKLELRIPLRRRNGPDGVIFEPEAANLNPLMRSSLPGTLLGPDSHASFTSEYNALRSQYRQAKAALAAAEARFNQSVANAQKARPETTVDEIKRQFPLEWRAVERARPDFEAAHRLLETKLDLFELDRKTARLARDAAEAQLMELTDRYKQNTATRSEVNQQRTAFEAADLNVERATTLLNFFKSISSEPVLESSNTAQGEAASSSNDPVTLSEFGRREATAMLQGTWNCVAAIGKSDFGPPEKHLSKDELVALALRLTITDHNVTIRYSGDDLQEHQTAGKLLIDASTSPPQFHIDINVAGIQAQSRLSGVTRLDRGVLRMSRPGGTFLIHRKFESEPAAFEFKRPSSLEDGKATSGTQSNPATRVPAEVNSELVSPRDMVALNPVMSGINCDQPAEDEIDSCRVVLEPGSAWSLLSRGGVLLRRFEDTNRDGVCDSWRYYQAGKLVYRDVDTDFDGKADRHESPEGIPEEADKPTTTNDQRGIAPPSFKENPEKVERNP